MPVKHNHRGFSQIEPLAARCANHARKGLIKLPVLRQPLSMIKVRYREGRTMIEEDIHTKGMLFIPDATGVVDEYYHGSLIYRYNRRTGVASLVYND